jgi:hypothetical protein
MLCKYLSPLCRAGLVCRINFLFRKCNTIPDMPVKGNQKSIEWGITSSKAHLQGVNEKKKSSYSFFSNPNKYRLTNASVLAGSSLSTLSVQCR